MRLNHPVHDTEFHIPPGQTLVSTTDLKGRIVHCNPAFVAVSGYAKDELLGQPHNLIRHPDMPEEAFRDMWQTIAAGRPWSAPVKNRRKDGSHYWVMANVTPLMLGDRPSGYMSVRTVPTREEVAAAQALYDTMRAERAAGRLVHRLEAGALRIDTPAGRLRRALRPGPRGRLGAAGAVLAGLGALAGGAAWPVLAAVAAAGGLASAWLLGRLAAPPLQGALDFANRMAAGDLTQHLAVGSDDELGQLGQALNQLNVNLRSIVADARSEVEQMRDATREIAGGNQDLAARTESQAASLQQTASSMEQITGTVRQSADAAGRATRLADDATAVTQRGSEAVQQVTQTMEVISAASRRIGEIIQVIEGIAFQTNILALNAAVEAARAGDAGRGFAVVAAEVRALSQRTTGAARQIRQLIAASAETVEAGNRQSEAAQATIAQALATVRAVGAAIAEISHGAQEQLGGISQVNEAVSQMDGITQQNAALVEQIAASALQLQGQAAQVADAVQVFRLDRRDLAAGTDAVALRRAAKQQAREAGHAIAA